MKENRAAPSLPALRRELRRGANKTRAAAARRFFKTDPGEYGEGDLFLGLTVPQVRAAAARHAGLGLSGIKTLLFSPYHEERLAALLVLAAGFAAGNAFRRRQIFNLYLKHSRRINNWDLVDLSAPRIAGAYLWDRSRRPLRRLARSPSLWERRIAVVATHYFISRGEFDDTLEIAAMLLGDREDLIHKACGWMLREVGKRDVRSLEGFLALHACRMPRTMLRYAIERFPEKKRKALLRASRCRRSS